MELSIVNVITADCCSSNVNELTRLTIILRTSSLSVMNDSCSTITKEYQEVSGQFQVSNAMRVVYEHHQELDVKWRKWV